MGILTKTLKSCKQDLFICVHKDDNNNYWLGSSHVMVNLGKEFNASSMDILAMLELPQEKADAVTIFASKPVCMCPVDETGPLEMLPYSLNVSDISAQPFKCEYGTIFVQRKYLDIFKDLEKEETRFYLAHLVKSLFAVNVYCHGELKGIIYPLKMRYDELCHFAAQLKQLTSIAAQNNFLRADEQLSIYDGVSDAAEAGNGEE